LFESLVLQKFPNASKVQITEITQKGSVDWMFKHNTIESEIFDKFIMLKKLLQDETKKEE
jgi:hypothetical protein